MMLETSMPAFCVFGWMRLSPVVLRGDGEPNLARGIWSRISNAGGYTRLLLTPTYDFDSRNFFAAWYDRVVVDSTLPARRPK
jgi:hypothetical protein